MKIVTLITKRTPESNLCRCECIGVDTRDSIFIQIIQSCGKKMIVAKDNIDVFEVSEIVKS